MKNLIYFISGITMANYFRIISKRKTVILLAPAALVTASAVSAQETITFPARSSNLATYSYWTVSEFSEGCCKLDLNVMRWNGSKWAGNKSGGKNSDDYTWNVPLYAPANGVIAEADLTPHPGCLIRSNSRREHGRSDQEQGCCAEGAGRSGRRDCIPGSRLRSNPCGVGAGRFLQRSSSPDR